MHAMRQKTWPLGEPQKGGKEIVMSLLREFVRGESGQDMAEYGIALAVIAVGAALIAIAIAPQAR